jgi:O-antigen ligase
MSNRFNLTAFKDYVFPISWKHSPVDFVWGLIFFFAIPGVTWVAIFFPFLLMLAWKEKRYQVVKNKWDMISWMMMAIFAWMVMGTLYSEPDHQPMKLLEQKLTWVVLPVLMFFIPSQLNKHQAIRLFALGVSFTALVLFVQALVHQMTNVDGHIWTGSNFTHPFHRSYWAAYAFFGALYFMNEALERRSWGQGGISTWLLITVFLSESKAGTLMIFVLLPVFVVMKLVTHFQISKMKIWGIGISLMIVFLLCFAWIPKLNYRFQSAFNGIAQVKWENNASEESTQARLLMWRAAWETWREEPVIGHGLADANFEMKKWNVAKGNTGVAESTLNAHNQFLQVLVQGGVIAFGLLLVWLIMLWQKSTNTWQYWWWAIIVISLLFEAFFETRLGLVPVMIFTMIWKLEEHTSVRYIK